VVAGCEGFARRGHCAPSRARRTAATSSVIIDNIAANARDDAARSGVFGNSSRRGGAIWHETPNLPVRQPH